MSEVRSRRRLRHLVTPVFGALVAGYFAYHAFTGDRSLVNYYRLTHEVEEARGRLAAIRAERERLEHRVSLLRPESLDPDMLDERARWALGYVGNREIMILQSAREIPPTKAAGLASQPIN
jgi:cell division protein FtsB